MPDIWIEGPAVGEVVRRLVCFTCQVVVRQRQRAAAVASTSQPPPPQALVRLPRSQQVGQVEVEAIQVEAFEAFLFQALGGEGNVWLGNRGWWSGLCLKQWRSCWCDSTLV